MLSRNPRGVIALVGRPNVGKSTLFNVLTRSRDALVADYEGLTRDRRYGVARSEEGSFILVDTGGLTGADSGIEALTEKQVIAAIQESTLLAMVVDARDGVTPEDERIAQELRKTGKPIVLIVNKTDGLDERTAAADFYQLGMETVFPVSAAHRRGTGALFDDLLEQLPPEPESPDEDDSSRIKMAIVGRPNVGKSTLINRLLGEERVVAFDMPGTTRDTIEIPWERDGQAFTLIDTAGVRRRSKVSEAIEKFSIIKAMEAIERADITVMMVDATDGIVDQDATVLGHVLERGCPLVIAINKWDGLDTDQRDQVRRDLDRKLRFVPFAKQVIISALHGSGLRELMEAVFQAYRSSHQDFSSSRITRIVSDAFESHQPPMVQGRTAKLRYAHVGGHQPLVIVVHGNRVSTLPESYQRYLINVLQRELKLVGTPVALQLRSGDNPFKDKKNPLTRRQIAKRKRLKKFTTRRKK